MKSLRLNENYFTANRIRDNVRVSTIDLHGKVTTHTGKGKILCGVNKMDEDGEGVINTEGSEGGIR